jgi:acyl carrier protein
MSALVLTRQALAKVKRDPVWLEASEDLDLIDDVGLDSLETLQLLLELEDAIGRRIDYDRLEYSMLRSLRALAAFLDGESC